MNVNTKQYRQYALRYLELPDNGLLLNTKDVLDILGIDECPKGGELSQPCLDLASAVMLASSSDVNFAMWLNEAFFVYNPETLVRSICDDD